ncbi:uncharacterized protein BYT42DRAFT_528026 [Radiomyces spectabilis]|uniref:uncharacterized protein n=1 Tax=Radiomyces spectabilis TaxID=64574 RepID=UPI00221F85E5|nr:uncharacterized protein BYT42DRAFT_528026 [Radiomyces spectabilis]KAI8388228.1 hypothetical protein BYT42DRAFT_528026 [Radiomyces spectabilis]
MVYPSGNSVLPTHSQQQQPSSSVHLRTSSSDSSYTFSTSSTAQSHRWTMPSPYIPSNPSTTMQPNQAIYVSNHPNHSPHLVSPSPSPSPFSSLSPSNPQTSPVMVLNNNNDSRKQTLAPPPPPAAGAPPGAAAPTVGENGQPIKIRKKPGRKPNPASPALRKAQNRAAQRAFRERKERHLKDLESTIKVLREQRTSAVRDANVAKGKLDALRAENWYLKGVVLTLQFVCMHHHIHIPTHSPYLSEEALSEMAQTAPHAIEAYVNAYTRNNINLKPTMAAHFANVRSPEVDYEEEEYQRRERERSNTSLESQPESGLYGGEETIDPNALHFSSPASSAFQRDRMGSSSEPSSMAFGEEDLLSRSYKDVDLKLPSRSPSAESGDPWSGEATIKQEPMEEHQTMAQLLHKEGQPVDDSKPMASSLSAIQRIRLQLRVQSTLTNVGNSAVRLQPTILQLAIPHDPRIDLIPTPHMRDRMIIFRDQMDYDRCFAMLLNGAVYHGGDPTMSASWELPAEFFSEFWYLATNYDVNRTNKWRRLKGLPEISVGPKQEEQQQQQQHQPHQQQSMPQQPPMQDPASQQTHYPASYMGQGSNPFQSSAWANDILSSMGCGMPTLQPLSHQQGFDFSPPGDVMMDLGTEPTHLLYEQFMGPSSHDRHSTQSPNIDVMMDLMTSLSTDMT